MKLNRAITFVMFFLALTGIFAQQLPQPIGQPPAKYDYVVHTDTGDQYTTILRDKAEIEAKLKAESATNPESARLAPLKWDVVTKWRLDPVTVKGGPIEHMPPTLLQRQELFGAIDDVLEIPQAGKDELKMKIATGNCRMMDALPTRFFERMVNGKKPIEKIEVVPELADRTKSCEFKLDSVQTIVYIIYDCGNFTFAFAKYQFVTKPSAPAIQPPPQPTAVTCTLSANGQAGNPNMPISLGLYPDQQITLTGRSVGEVGSLQLRATWSELKPGASESEVITINPNFKREDALTFGSNTTNFLIGRYRGNFTLSDQFGRMSSCPFEFVVNPRLANPPNITQNLPPESSKDGSRKAEKPHKKWPYILAAGIVAAGVGGYFATRGHNQNQKTWQPGWTPTTGAIGSAAGFNISFGGRH